MKLVRLLCLALLLPLPARAEVLPGVEVLARDHAQELAGRRIGILTNPTGVTRQRESTIDVVRRLPGVEVVRLFSPEHGLRGQHFAGDRVDEAFDPVSGLPVVSLYGATRKPSAEMLAGLDLVLYDIQDVGHRTYTFVSTLTYLMEACADSGVGVWVLDRPDPLGGDRVGGPMIDESLLSFIGIHPVPQVYGMTPGEWARMIQAERTPAVDLRVIPLQGWRRGMTYGDLGWIWVPTSQHVPHWETAFFYAMTGTLGELGLLNNGVGTPAPFELVGAPWLDADEFGRRLAALRIPGVLFRPTSFRPRYAFGADELMHGVQIHVSDYRRLDPARVSAALMATLQQLSPAPGLFDRLETPDGKPGMFLKALGDREMARRLAAGKSVDPGGSMAREREAFLGRRARYLLYP